MMKRIIICVVLYVIASTANIYMCANLRKAHVKRTLLYQTVTMALSYTGYYRKVKQNYYLPPDTLVIHGAFPGDFYYPNGYIACPQFNGFVYIPPWLRNLLRFSWTNCESPSGDGFWRHEFMKHGTCITKYEVNQINNPSYFYERIISFYNYKQYRYLISRAFDTVGNKYITVGEFKKRLIKTMKNQQKATEEENIIVVCDKINELYYLKEIQFVYDDDWNISHKKIIRNDPRGCELETTHVFIFRN